MTFGDDIAPDWFSFGLGSEAVVVVGLSIAQACELASKRGSAWLASDCAQARRNQQNYVMLLASTTNPALLYCTKS